VRCYQHGKLMQEAKRAAPKALYATAGKTQNGKELIMKLVNAGSAPLAIAFQLRGAQSVGEQGTAFVLTSKNANDENSFLDPKRVAPVESKMTGLSKSFTRTLPPLSVTILRMALKDKAKGTGL